MFSTQSDICILIYPYFDIISLSAAAEFEEPKIGISGKGLIASQSLFDDAFMSLSHSPTFNHLKKQDLRLCLINSTKQQMSRPVLQCVSQV